MASIRECIYLTGGGGLHFESGNELSFDPGMGLHVIRKIPYMDLLKAINGIIHDMMGSAASRSPPSIRSDGSGMRNVHPVCTVKS